MFEHVCLSEFVFQMKNVGCQQLVVEIPVLAFLVSGSGVRNDSVMEQHVVVSMEVKPGPRWPSADLDNPC